MNNYDLGLAEGQSRGAEAMRRVMERLDRMTLERDALKRRVEELEGQLKGTLSAAKFALGGKTLRERVSNASND